MYLCGRSGFVLSSLVCFALDLFCEKARPSRVKSSSRREEFYYHSNHFLLAMQYKVQERQSVYSSQAVFYGGLIVVLKSIPIFDIQTHFT